MKVDADGVNYFRKFGSPTSTTNFEDLNRKLTNGGVSSDLEIRCKNGAVVKCHSELLASNKWQKKLENDLKESTRRPIAMRMELSEECVKGFLEWNHCKQVPKAVGEKFDLALELLKAGREYEVKELETEMEKILMSKGTKDMEYFSVVAALNLYLYAKDVEELKGLRDKAVRILKK